MLILHEHAMERKIRDMKFSAILHGADPKDLEGKEMPSVTQKDNLLFGDPKDYENMSDEKRKEISDKMKSKYINWAKAK